MGEACIADNGRTGQLSCVPTPIIYHVTTLEASVSETEIIKVSMPNYDLDVSVVLAL